MEATDRRPPRRILPGSRVNFSHACISRPFPSLPACPPPSPWRARLKKTKQRSYLLACGHNLMHFNANVAALLAHPAQVRFGWYWSTKGQRFRIVEKHQGRVTKEPLRAVCVCVCVCVCVFVTQDNIPPGPICKARQLRAEEGASPEKGRHWKDISPTPFREPCRLVLES